MLAIMGLMMALVSPNLVRLGASVESATQRDGVLADVNALGHRAWILGEGVDLGPDTVGRLMRDGNPVLALPEGWHLPAQDAIHYSAAGYCEGGRLLVQESDGSVDTLTLRPPRCQAERQTPGAS